MSWASPYGLEIASDSSSASTPPGSPRRARSRLEAEERHHPIDGRRERVDHHRAEVGRRVVPVTEVEQRLGPACPKGVELEVELMLLAHPDAVVEDGHCEGRVVVPDDARAEVGDGVGHVLGQVGPLGPIERLTQARRRRSARGSRGPCRSC